MGVLDKLDNATTGTVSVELILDAALDAKWTALSEELSQAYEADAKSLAGSASTSSDDDQDDAPAGASLALPAVTRVVEDMEEIRDQVIASQVTFWFEPVDWRERIAMQAEHPPRQHDLLDQTRGYNALTFIPALIKAACVGVTDNDDDEPTPVPDSKWDFLLGVTEDLTTDPPREYVKPKLVHNQIARLFAAAQETDQGATRVPPSARSLLGTQDSGASLAQPSPGTSPRSGSAGGSRRTSRKSSTAKKAAPKKAASSGS